MPTFAGFPLVCSLSLVVLLSLVILLSLAMISFTWDNALVTDLSLVVLCSLVLLLSLVNISLTNDQRWNQDFSRRIYRGAVNLPLFSHCQLGQSSCPAHCRYSWDVGSSVFHFYSSFSLSIGYNGVLGQMLL